MVVIGGTAFSDCLAVHTEESADDPCMSARLATRPQTPPLPGTLTDLARRAKSTLPKAEEWAVASPASIYVHSRRLRRRTMSARQKMFRRESTKPMTEGPHFVPPRMVFNPPPNWPVEPGFTPGEGWRPDLFWGPAPEGWTFWVPQDPSVNAGREPSLAPSGEPGVSGPPVSHVTPDDSKSKKRWPVLVAAIAAVVLLVVGAVALVQQQQRMAEELAAANEGYDSSVSALNSSIATAEGALDRSENRVLDESSRDILEAELTGAAEAVAADIDPDDAEALVTQSSLLDDARSDLEDAARDVEEEMTRLADLVALREGTAAGITSAREELPIAEKLLAESDGKVNNSRLRDDLASAIETLRTLAVQDPEVLDTAKLGAFKADVGRARRVLEIAAEKVTEDQARWQKATDEALAAAELSDPAAYASISSREWQLVERDPAAHKDEKYVIFGKVTQFDSNTGRAVFRANTDGQKQSRSYNYDINTMVTSTEELLTNVVQGDLVKLFVSVSGPYSYDTTLGGKLTVPMVEANIVEVYGSD